MMKLQESDKKNKYTDFEGPSFRAKQSREGRGNEYSLGGSHQEETVLTYYHSKHTFHEGSSFEQEDEEQQASTEQNENREQQDLSEATLELHQNAETLLKEMRWSKTMLLQDS